MFDYKAVATRFTKLNPLNWEAQAIPADFGSMYLLYPTENDGLVAFPQRNRLDKMVETVRLRWQRAKDNRYYKQNSIF